MEEHKVRHLPVLDDDECLIGIVTDSDIREAEMAGSVLSSYEPEASASWLTVGDIMTPDVITIALDATVGELAVTLIENKSAASPWSNRTHSIPSACVWPASSPRRHLHNDCRCLALPVR